jgi:glucokinase
VILAGDIGGTSTRLALFAPDELREPVGLDIFPSSEFSGVTAVVERFLSGHDAGVDAASFGVAGPVREGRSLPVNLEWPVDSGELGVLLGLARVGLVNDLEATALGLALLGADDLVTLSNGAPDEHGTVAVIAAGTGLGQAGLVPTGDAPTTVATEGGNAGFAPASAEETRLLAFLRAELGEHVSVEVACSGYGLVNIYRWCLHEAGRALPEWLLGESHDVDPAAIVSRLGASGEDGDAARALETFVRIYGSEAGNLALRLFATGGVYVAGGIAGKLLDVLRNGVFMEAFTSKGRLSELMRSIPVHVVTNDLTALLGAAQHAARARLASQGSNEEAA